MQPYKRVLLKLSGEALMGSQKSGIKPSIIKRIAQDISRVLDLDVEIGLVVGGGNIFRGVGLAESGIDRVTADHMGMLATVMNALALQDALEKEGVVARVMSAIKVNDVCEDYIRRRAIRHLEKKRVVIFAAGTGNPFFTTDTAASLRAIEINADLLIKATKVNGIYSSDPVISKNAHLYKRLTYDDVLDKNLGVMDATSIVMCKENRLPLVVFNINNKGDMVRLLKGDNVGTVVTNMED
ncbi:MAG: UMP kinase [Pseudomonadota bacterium]|nr:UMP kinase [Gammaproteobacteria bacterium]MEE2684437.1 UMP kinase [Pseudomonadota bacterium]|tara:strand:- start:51 stop:770 length:720 start_codon:yes stop_codon:yes gene_type:complete